MISSLAANHASNQRKLTTLAATETSRLVVPQRDRSSLGVLVKVLAALVGQYNRASASLAADYYEAERDAADVRSPLRTPLADPLPDEQVTRALGWATRDLADDYVDLDEVLGRVEGTTTRMTLAGARDTITAAVDRDPRARGYTRIPLPDACAFCAMLGLRVIGKNGRVQGVYKSEDTALFASNGDKYHDYCRCTAQVIFAGQDYTPPDYIQAWADLYRDSTSVASGKDKLPAFRAALTEHRGEHAH